MNESVRSNHHWWPKCVSRLWANERGRVHWLSPDGTDREEKPAVFGAIGAGHSIQLSDTPGETTPWDDDYEGTFQTADDAFPDLIAELESLDFRPPRHTSNLTARMQEHQIPDDRFLLLIECLVSLAVRSPMHRQLAAALAEELFGPLSRRKRNAIIGSNIRYAMERVIRGIGTSGKALAIHSPNREFIFGDGFFHNIAPPGDHVHQPKMLVPLTPRLAVLFARPGGYMAEPRFCTLTVTSEEADVLNHAVQVHASQMLFYRNEKPAILAPYAHGKHATYRDDRNPVDTLIYSMPGVEPRDDSMDYFRDLYGS
jgi:hypothetical protein